MTTEFPADAARHERAHDEPLQALSFGDRVYPWVFWIALVLMVVDVGSIWLILTHLGTGWDLGLALALFAGFFGTYKAQFQHLLSKDAFLVHGSPGRHLAMALFVLCGNVGCFWLVARKWFIFYVFTRILLAIVVVWAWGWRLGPVRR